MWPLKDTQVQFFTSFFPIKSIIVFCRTRGVLETGLFAHMYVVGKPFLTLHICSKEGIQRRIWCLPSMNQIWAVLYLLMFKDTILTHVLREVLQYSYKMYTWHSACTCCCSEPVNVCLLYFINSLIQYIPGRSAQTTYLLPHNLHL